MDILAFDAMRINYNQKVGELREYYEKLIEEEKKRIDDYTTEGVASLTAEEIDPEIIKEKSVHKSGHRKRAA